MTEHKETFKDLEICGICGGKINFHNGLELFSSPPKYQFPCNGCGDLKVFNHKQFVIIQRAKVNGEWDL